MNALGPLWTSTLISLVLALVGFFKARPRRGKLAAGFGAACVIFLAATFIRTLISRATRSLDPFEVLGLSPTKESIGRLAKLARRRFPNNAELHATIAEINEMPPDILAFLWPYMTTMALRCPYAQESQVTVFLMTVPALLLRFLSYLGQILVAMRVCPRTADAKVPLIFVAVFGLVADIFLVAIPRERYLMRPKYMLQADLVVSLGMMACIALESVILAPNRLDAVSVLRNARAQLDTTNRLNAACKNVTEEICSSEELLLLYGGWVRSVGGQPPQRSEDGPVALVRKSEDPATFALHYSG